MATIKKVEKISCEKKERGGKMFTIIAAILIAGVSGAGPDACLVEGAGSA